MAKGKSLVELTDFILTLRTSLEIILQVDKLSPKIVTQLCCQMEVWMRERVWRLLREALPSVTRSRLSRQVPSVQ